MGNKYSFVLASITLIATIFDASSGLGKVEIVEPQGQYVPLGKNMKLVCSYDLEGDKLYLVQWFRYASEFFRFVPKQVPAGQAFPQLLLNVSEMEYDARSVTILNVSQGNSGAYVCAVTVERSFEARRATKHVTVAAVPEGPPELREDSSVYHIGDMVTAVCKVRYTTPLVKISWYMDDYQLLKNTSKKHLAVPPESCQNSSVIEPQVAQGPVMCNVTEELDFPVTSYVPFRIACAAKVGEIYNERSRSILVQAQPRPVVPTQEPQELMAPATKSSGKVKSELATRLPRVFDHEYGGVQTSRSGRIEANWVIQSLLVLLCALHS